MSIATNSYTRRSIRFRPEKPTIARARLLAGRGFTDPIPGIVRDESYRGCCVIFKAGTDVSTDCCGLIGVGNLAELKFRVVWTAPMRDGYVKAGIEYLE